MTDFPHDRDYPHSDDRRPDEFGHADRLPQPHDQHGYGDDDRHPHDCDDDLSATGHELLVAIYRKLRLLMSTTHTTAAQFQKILDDLRVDVGGISTTVGAIATDTTGVASNVATLKQMIVDLQAQIGTGAPITQQQLNALAAQATDADAAIKDIAAKLAAADAALQPLAGGVTPPAQAPPKLALVPVALTVGVPTSFVIALAVDSGVPTSASASPLPNGLAFDTSTGLITGTPTTLGDTTVSVSVSNDAGGDTGTLVISVTDVAQPPVEVPPGPVTAQGFAAPRARVAGAAKVAPSGDPREPVDHSVKS